jgi:hypothetical protein
MKTKIIKKGAKIGAWRTRGENHGLSALLLFTSAVSERSAKEKKKSQAKTKQHVSLVGFLILLKFTSKLHRAREKLGRENYGAEKNGNSQLSNDLIWVNKERFFSFSSWVRVRRNRRRRPPPPPASSTAARGKKNFPISREEWIRTEVAGTHLNEPGKVSPPDFCEVFRDTLPMAPSALAEQSPHGSDRLIDKEKEKSGLMRPLSGPPKVKRRKS